MKKEPKQNLTVRVDPDAIAILKSRGVNISELVNNAVEDAAKVKRCLACGALKKA